MNIAELLNDLTTHYNGIIRRTASRLQLTASQAFHLLSIPPGGISMSKLASKLGLDTSTLTRNIQKLEKLDLIERRSDEYDKRVQNAVLTKQGIDIANSIEEELSQVYHSVLEQIDLESQENLPELLEKLVWAMECIREK